MPVMMLHVTPPHTDSLGVDFASAPQLLSSRVAQRGSE